MLQLFFGQAEIVWEENLTKVCTWYKRFMGKEKFLYREFLSQIYYTMQKLGCTTQ